MLQKFIITLCTVFALSACGGDDQDDQSRVVLNPPEDLNAGEDEEPEEPGEEPEEPEEPQEPEEPEEPEEPQQPEEPVEPWLSIMFDEATDLETWSYACVSAECNATAAIEHNAEAAALNVTPTWATAGDEIEVSTTIDPEIADLVDGFAHLNLYVPESHAGMIAQVFFQDASDRKGYIGYAATAAGWNSFYFENLAVDDFGFVNEGFELTLINRIGVQIQSSEDVLELEDTLHIDDVIISPEAIEVDEKTSGEDPEPVTDAPATPPAGDISYQFDSNIDDWHLNGTGNNTTTETAQIILSHDEANGALSIAPQSWDANASENYRYESRIELDSADLSAALARLVVFVPEAYITDGGLELQLIAGSSYGPNITELNAGFNVIDVDLSERAEDISSVGTLGLQLSIGPNDDTILDPILLHSMDVYLDGTVPSNSLSVPVDADWTNDGSPTTFSYDNGVVMTPDWSAGDEQKGFVVISEPVDLTGATVTYVVDVPEAYITDGGMVIQPFSQQNGNPGYDGIFDGSISGGWNPASGLQAGENTIVHGPFSEPPVNIERIGLTLVKSDKADGVTGNVTIRSITINFPD